MNDDRPYVCAIRVISSFNDFRSWHVESLSAQTLYKFYQNLYFIKMAQQLRSATRVIQHHARRGETAQMEEQFSRLVQNQQNAKGFSPSSSSNAKPEVGLNIYTSLLSGYAKAKDANGADKCMKRILESSVKADAILYDTLIHAYGRYMLPKFGGALQATHEYHHWVGSGVSATSLPPKCLKDG